MRKSPRRMWSADRDDRLMDMASDGLPFEVCAKAMQISRNAAIGRFHRLRESMGWQAS